MKSLTVKAAVLSAVLCIALSAEASAAACPEDHAKQTSDAASAPADPQDVSRQPEKHRGRGHFIFRESALLFGMEGQELHQALKSGKSLAEVAKEKKGWSEDQYVQKLTEKAGTRIDEAVTGGRLTSEEGAKLKAGLPAMLKAKVNRKCTDFGHDGHQNPGKRQSS
ncbi:hypothetical protein KIH86_19460 [Paenibacillus sp. HN-1]|uniref:hypothetical protein n=1 Tax=Paenibacillus TaxID=44249 RepID=UPI001CA9E269|nr:MULTISPECIES: hypothetical protein [Paenibacillus]MBY9082249.1 hypothetical protein [Paenibacillus sp. CGMCC 1.18879]MBY9086387.1 hypothetical protein [Paenibacillus sinensis]